MISEIRVTVDGREVEPDIGAILEEAVGKIVSVLTDPRGQEVLAQVVASAVQQEFNSRDMVWTGRLISDVAVEGSRIVFYAPHAWKFASGYHRTAKKRKNGLWHAAGSKDITLTRWVEDKAPHLNRRSKFRIRIPEDHGFKEDAYAEAVEKRIEGIIDAWLTVRIKEALSKG